MIHYHLYDLLTTLSCKNEMLYVINKLILYHLYDLFTKPYCEDVINKMIPYYLYNLVNCTVV